MFRRYTKHQYATAFRSIGSTAMGFKDYRPSDLYPTITSFIKDRDFPLKHIEILCILKLCLGRWPSPEEISLCRPDDDHATDSYRDEMIADYQSVYGEE